MNKFEIFETENFLLELESVAEWIFTTNLEQSESLADKKINDLLSDLSLLRDRLKEFPESSEESTIKGIRKASIYEGRFQVNWSIDFKRNSVTLLSISDLKYPKKLKNFKFDEE